MAYNVSQIAEGGEIEVLNLNIKRMLNRSTTVDISTKPPLLAMCCYTLPFLYLKNISLKMFVYSKQGCIFVNEIKNKTLCFTIEHHYTGMNLRFAMKSQTK
jgi:hypothetical protein